MHDNAEAGSISIPENEPYAVITAHFLKAWRQWLNRPTDAPRPEAVDNAPFICEHALLNFDPNSSTDFDSSFALIKRDDWDALAKL